MKQIELRVEGERFAALAAGPPGGTPVVLLHGFPDVPRSWARVMEPLAAAGCSCLAPWTRGYRPSTGAGPFDLLRLARDAVGLARAHFGARPFHLLGHDWGAVTGYVVATHHEEALASLVALSVPHPQAFLAQLARDPSQRRRSAYVAFFQVPFVSERAVRDAAFIERLYGRWSPGLAAPRAHLEEVVACMRASLPGPLGYYRAAFRPTSSALALARGPHRVRVPTLYLHGADDGCVAPPEGEARYFDGPYEREILASAGHFLPLEQPERIAERVRDWVARHARDRAAA